MRGLNGPVVILGAALILVAVAAGTQAPASDPQAVSPQGRPLYAQPLPEGVGESEAVVAARSALEAARDDDAYRSAVLELGQALDREWRYREAVSVYSTGLSRLRRDSELYLRRGIALLRLRNVERAIDDLRTATREDEENFEAWYRLGLAHYVAAEHKRAVRTLQQARRLARNDDEMVAALHWEYVSARRGDRRDDADDALLAVPEQVDLEQNADYFLLLQMYLGRVGERVVFNQDAPVSEQSSIRAYGVGSWHLETGGERRAVELFEIVVGSEDWPAISVIAAEKDLERLRG